MNLQAPEIDQASLSNTDRIKLRTFKIELKNGNLEAVESSRNTYAKRFAQTPLAAHAFYEACIAGMPQTAMTILRADPTLNPDALNNEERLSAVAYAKLQPAFRTHIAEIEKRVAAYNAQASAPTAPPQKHDAAAVTAAPSSKLPPPAVPVAKICLPSDMVKKDALQLVLNAVLSSNIELKDETIDRFIRTGRSAMLLRQLCSYGRVEDIKRVLDKDIALNPSVAEGNFGSPLDTAQENLHRYPVLKQALSIMKARASVLNTSMKEGEDSSPLAHTRHSFVPLEESAYARTTDTNAAITSLLNSPSMADPVAHAAMLNITTTASPTPLSSDHGISPMDCSSPDTGAGHSF